MSVLEEIQAELAARTLRCTVRQALDQLPRDVAEGYAQAIAMAAKETPGAAIERALRKRGVVLRQHAIQRHRRDACLCTADLLQIDG